MRNRHETKCIGPGVPWAQTGEWNERASARERAKPSKGYEAERVRGGAANSLQNLEGVERERTVVGQRGGEMDSDGYGGP